MRPLLRDQLIAALRSRGWIVSQDQRSNKYTTLVKFGQTAKYFVGRAGALRFGTCASKSTACSDETKKRLLNYVMFLDGKSKGAGER